jgi:chaperonin cofactor prefoldin
MSLKEELVEVIKALVLPEIAELKQDVTQIKTDIRLINGRLDLMDHRLDLMDQRFDQVDQRFGDMKADINQRFGDMKSDMDKRFDAVDRRFNSLEDGQESLRRDVAEVRSYVWTSGLDAMAKSTALIRENGAKYESKGG